MRGMHYAFQFLLQKFCNGQLRPMLIKVDLPLSVSNVDDDAHVSRVYTMVWRSFTITLSVMSARHTKLCLSMLHMRIRSVYVDVHIDTCGLFANTRNHPQPCTNTDCVISTPTPIHTHWRWKTWGLQVDVWLERRWDAASIHLSDGCYVCCMPFMAMGISTCMHFYMKTHAQGLQICPLSSPPVNSSYCCRH